MGHWQNDVYTWEKYCIEIHGWIKRKWRKNQNKKWIKFHNHSSLVYFGRDESRKNILPGASWSLMTWRSVKWQRLCTSSKLCLVLQLEQSVGSSSRPLSNSTVSVWRQTAHMKSPSRISGIGFEQRMTMPAIVINLSMSEITKVVDNEVNLIQHTVIFQLT